MSEAGFLKRKRKLRPGMIAVLILLHLAALYGLTRALAPDFTQSIERTVLDTFTVTITAPTEEPEIPDDGMQGDPGEDAVPQPVSAPTPRIPPEDERQLPQAASTGDATTSGATSDGAGTGARGTGDGTGAGDEGSGRGSTLASGPVKIAGTINSARDYPVPDGGREVRFGTAVRIAILVGTDGTPKRCRVFGSSGLPETDARTCELAMSRFRFEPARNSRGDPVEAEFGWEQRFRRAR